MEKILSHNWIPLTRVVDMAHVDDYDDAQVLRQRFYHWALRGYKKLHLNLLRRVKAVLLPINKGTCTAYLPPEYGDWIEVGVRSGCGSIELLDYVLHVEEPEADASCNCDTDLCSAITYERTEEVVTIKGLLYNKTAVRRFDKRTNTVTTEITEPYYNVTSKLVEMQSVVSDTCLVLDRKACGCIAHTARNFERLQACGFCCGPWGRYGEGYGWQGRGCCTGSFTINEDEGTISVQGNYDYVYLKFRAILPLKNGEVYVPEVAAETLVAWVLYKRDQRRSLPAVQKENSYQVYRRERKELRRAVLKLRLSQILFAFNLIDAATGDCQPCQPQPLPPLPQLPGTHVIPFIPPPTQTDTDMLNKYEYTASGDETEFPVPGLTARSTFTQLWKSVQPIYEVKETGEIPPDHYRINYETLAVELGTPAEPLETYLLIFNS